MGFDKRQGRFSYVVSIDPELCIGCKRCVTVCPRSNEIFEAEEKASVQVMNPRKCAACLQCQGVCPTSAIEISVKRKDIPKVDPEKQ